MYNSGVLTYTYEMTVRKNECTLEAEVITDFTKYNADKWEEDLEIPFPVALDDFTIDKTVDKSGNESQHMIAITGTQSDSKYSVEVINSKNHSIPNAVKVKGTGNAVIVIGKLSFHADSQYYKVAFSIKE